jgi:cytochrome c oxidase subunit II
VRAGSLIRVLLVALLLAAIATAVAIFVPWLPENASKQGDRIDFVFWFVTAICIAIFSVVASVSVYSLIKFRAKPDDDSDGPPIHGNTGIEITWTVIPFLLVTAMIIVSSVALAQNDRNPANSMRVEILGQQFAWVVAYPPPGATEDMDGFICFNPSEVATGEPLVDRRCRSSGNLILPLDRPARLHLTAREVIHSFFVPEFRQKQDAVPGLETEITVTPTKLGNFPFICTELCGLGHALMRTRAIVMPQSEFEQWRRRGPR